MGNTKTDKNNRLKPAAQPRMQTVSQALRLTPWFILSALLLTFCQAPWNLSFLAWLALVPFVLVCNPKTPRKSLMLAAYLVSFLYWMGNLYWIIPITGPGYIAFALWQAVYWPLLALGVRYLRTKNCPMILAVPILFVGAESIQSFLFTGFNWYFLAHSQYLNSSLIQIADLFGVFGISAVLAMSNGILSETLYSIFYRKSLFRLWIHLAAFAVILFAIGVYNKQSLYFNDHPQPKIGVIQTNIPTAVKEETENAQMILDDLLTQSNHCIAAGAKLILWPETMVLTSLNPGYRMYFDPNSEPVRFNKQIADFTGQKQIYLLLGAHGASVGDVGGQLEVTERFNSAYLYQPDGSQSSLRYDKIHLVPFGEVIPFKQSFPPLYRFFNLFSPYDFEYSLTAGKEAVLFPVVLENKKYHFGVLICYEDTDPAISRKMVYKNGNKTADWLVNISNDGWYVQFKDNRVIPSVELAQRTAICVFRCVENRISLVRSVNTGVSCLIDPYGRIQNQYLGGNLPIQGMARQGMAGWFVDAVPLDSRITFYTRYGAWIDKLPALGICLIAALAFMEKQKERKKQ
jgi:apolipoprotein N-acyltransferase